MLLLRVFKETFWAVVMHPFLAHLLTNGFVGYDPIFICVCTQSQVAFGKIKIKTGVYCNVIGHPGRTLLISRCATFFRFPRRPRAPYSLLNSTARIPGWLNTSKISRGHLHKYQIICSQQLSWMTWNAVWETASIFISDFPCDLQNFFHSVSQLLAITYCLLATRAKKISFYF